LPAPWEEVDGVTYEYHNHPAVFVQPHIALFQRERRHYRRYRETMREFANIPLRWLEAEDCYERWLHQYQQDELLRIQQEARQKAAGGA